MGRKWAALSKLLMMTTTGTQYMPALRPALNRYHLVVKPARRGNPTMDRAARVKTAMGQGKMRPIPLKP